MSQCGIVRATVVVRVDAAAAFEVFTSEIDCWYKRGPHSFHEPDKALAIRFEPRVGGRLMEVYDLKTGEGRELARILVWEPGRRIVFVDERKTEVEVRFEPGEGGTRVSLEHRGLDQLTPELAQTLRKYGWRLLLAWFDEHISRQGSE